MFDYLIIGAGFAGLTIAERIANKLNKKVLVIEKRKHIGGNCYDCLKEGLRIQLYGPHIFHTKDKNVWNYLSNFTDWLHYQHEVKSFIDNKFVPVPFNLNSLEMLFPEDEVKKLIDKLIKIVGFDKKISIFELLQIEDKDLKFLANYVYKKVFYYYTYKQWGIKLENLSEEVLKRVPVNVSYDDRYFPSDAYQGIPKDGFEKLFENMVKSKNIKILLGTDFKEVLSIDKKRKKFYFLGQEFKGKIIYTAKLDELFDYEFGRLPYRTLDIKFKSYEEEYHQPNSVVNYPFDYDFMRVTEYKYFYFQTSSHTILSYEYPRNASEKDIPYYNILTDESIALSEKYKDIASEYKDLILIGRLAEFKYYNMDSVVKRALEIFELL